MDGVGPVRPPDPKVFVNPPVWKREGREKPKPQPTSDDHDPSEEPLEEEDEVHVELPAEDHHIDLEA